MERPRERLIVKKCACGNSFYTFNSGRILCDDCVLNSVVLKVGEPSKKPDEVRMVIRCESCGNWMITTDAMRKTCQMCIGRLNVSKTLKEEENKHNMEQAAWEAMERRMINDREVG